MPREFDVLRERLVHAGVGGGAARRYIAELKDHFDDLLAEERRAGRSPDEAKAQAMLRLGDTEALAQAMIARPELRAWSARAPLAAYVVAPVVVLAMATVAWVAVVVGAVSWLRSPAGLAPDVAAWVRPAADGIAWVSNTALAVLLGWGLAAMAIRRRTSALWPLLGLVGLAAVGAALQVQVTLPMGGAPGEIDLSPGGALPFGAQGYAGRFALDLAAMMAPYGLISLWRSAQARVAG